MNKNANYSLTKIMLDELKKSKKIFNRVQSKLSYTLKL